MRKTFRILALLSGFSAVVAVAGCGIRPASVDGRSGYPATYPDTRYDPAPEGIEQTRRRP